MPDQRDGSPSALVPDGAVGEPLEVSVDPEEFTPRLLALLSNALVWRESRELRQRFSLGTNEWRVLSSLASRPGMSATEVSEFLDMNKAVVSKSVNVLVERGLVVLSDGPRGSRPLYLTQAGARMHDGMLPISMRGQEIILGQLSERESKQFNALLRGMLVRLKEEGLRDEEALAAG
ncbi:MarR family winged helix-turn-helix transcriptional regulator [Sinomonas atrocyanea]|jgi:DNA-binding MarR family transcriptional regulator|uniref:MarR family winged helix-turn-helix transcriptional regulator n=1 Tax=Sinomonas atrocyanea TaxID=37927 RepID=UPI00278655DB|nr:MarR family winged helix-turn-helix transcriptional regulator [Sinomonas atrocyanea]MDQ0260404.1 DNA-binding MarR family transcriptional regulator [Sinomonas atrocyanea]MDR6622368.1 DNA-binding MarR family transcriptional regulator [Sinomonas atrocyanea]